MIIEILDLSYLTHFSDIRRRNSIIHNKTDSLYQSVSSPYSKVQVIDAQQASAFVFASENKEPIMLFNETEIGNARIYYQKFGKECEL